MPAQSAGQSVASAGFRGGDSRMKCYVSALAALAVALPVLAIGQTAQADVLTRTNPQGTHVAASKLPPTLARRDGQVTPACCGSGDGYPGPDLAATAVAKRDPATADAIAQTNAATVIPATAAAATAAARAAVPAVGVTGAIYSMAPAASVLGSLRPTTSTSEQTSATHPRTCSTTRITTSKPSTS